MTQSGFIAVIDLGTSKIKGVVGRKNENGVISILANSSLDSDNSIRRGTVYNTEKTGGNVHKLIMMLENSLERKITKVYVSLSGQSLRTLDFNEMLHLSSGMVTEVEVDKLRKSAEKFKPDLKHNFGIADVEYYIDGKPELSPVGITGSEIEAVFKLIVGRPNLKTNIERSITEKNGIEIAGYVVGSMASAAIALNNEEKELGCAFLDFGAGTTSLSVYKGGILRRMVVIPFGGKNLTKDICALNFTESDAEQLKIKFGKAFDSHDGPMFQSPFSSKPDVDLAELNKVIGMRLDEITANIKEQIALSGYEGQLGAGLIITGGASQLKNLDLYLTQKLKMPVRKTSSKKTLVNNSPELINDPSFTQVLGMLLLGEKNCEEVISENDEVEEDNGGGYKHVTSRWFSGFVKGQKTDKPPKPIHERKPKPEKPKGGIISKMGNVFEGFFIEDENEDENKNKD